METEELLLLIGEIKESQIVLDNIHLNKNLQSPNHQNFIKNLHQKNT